MILCMCIGTLLLSCSKDNSNRLWDIRSTSPLRRLKGHSNTSKNFVKACFAGDDAIVVGGSEVGYYLFSFEFFLSEFLVFIFIL
jgi:WD40 repeat protein